MKKIKTDYDGKHTFELEYQSSMHLNGTQVFTYKGEDEKQIILISEIIIDKNSIKSIKDYYKAMKKEFNPIFYYMKEMKLEQRALTFKDIDELRQEPNEEIIAKLSPQQIKFLKEKFS